MATRFYLPSSGSPPVAPPTLTGWTAGTVAHVTRPTGTAKSGTALTDFNVPELLTANFNVPVAAFVSGLLAAQSIAGTISAVVRGFQESSGSDDSLQVGAYLIAGDGSSIKQTLYGGHTELINVGVLGQEFASAAQTRIIPTGTAITTQSAATGDRLMIVVGYRAHGTSAGTLRSATLRLGDPSATADFALTAGLTTDLAPWVELSADLVFDDGGGDADPAEGAAATALLLTVAATGRRVSAGTAATTLLLTGSATGSAPSGTPEGSAATSLVLTAGASGGRKSRGSAATDLALAGSASGGRQSRGSASVALLLTVSASSTPPLVPGALAAGADDPALAAGGTDPVLTAAAVIPTLTASGRP